MAVLPVNPTIGRVPAQTEALAEAASQGRLVFVQRTWFQFFQALYARGNHIPVLYAATNFTANGTMTWTVQSADHTTLTYMQVGKTFTMVFVLVNTSTGGVANTTLQILIPLARTAARVMANPVVLRDNGTRVMGVARVAAGGTTVNIQRLDGANFTASANATDVEGMISFEIEG